MLNNQRVIYKGKSIPETSVPLQSTHVLSILHDVTIYIYIYVYIHIIQFCPRKKPWASPNGIIRLRPAPAISEGRTGSDSARS